jgi:hypothetical protein
MPRYHTVQQGEHLARIALQYGYPDYRPLWSHAGNAALRTLRGSPDVLLPGDQVMIPDEAAREERRATNARHRFTVSVARPTIRVALEGLLGQPMRSARGELRVDGRSVPFVADGHGIVQHAIPVGAERADLVLSDEKAPGAERSFALFIGHLDPVTEVSGQESRLNNLGYRAGLAGDAKAYDFRSAVEEFQCDYGLVVDGKCGPVTQRKLVAIHGS